MRFICDRCNDTVCASASSTKSPEEVRMGVRVGGDMITIRGDNGELNSVVNTYVFRMGLL